MCTVLLPPGDNPIAVNKYIAHTGKIVARILRRIEMKIEDMHG